MLRFKINIDCVNDAFSPSPNFEVARILRDLADNVEDMELRPGDESRKKLMDSNGNTCGEAGFDEKPHAKSTTQGAGR